MAEKDGAFKQMACDTPIGVLRMQRLEQALAQSRGVVCQKHVWRLSVRGVSLCPSLSHDLVIFFQLKGVL